MKKTKLVGGAAQSIDEKATQNISKLTEIAAALATGARKLL
jgi:hypothetical protein